MRGEGGGWEGMGWERVRMGECENGRVVEREDELSRDRDCRYHRPQTLAWSLDRGRSE